MTIFSILSRAVYSMILPFQLMLAVPIYGPRTCRRHFIPRAAAAFAVIFCFGLASALLFPTNAAGTSAMENLPVILLYSAISYGVAFLYALWLYPLSAGQLAYLTTRAYLTQHFAYCLYTLTSSFITGWDHLRGIVLYGGVYVCFWLMFVRNLPENAAGLVSTAMSIRGTTVGLSAALILSAFAQRFSMTSRVLYRVLLFYAMFCAYYMLWSQTRQLKSLHVQHELDTERQLRRIQREQYELSVRTSEAINRKCHDLKHQIAALKRISDRAEREESIRSLEEAVMIYDSFVRTGNEALDAVLTDKALVCESRGITLTCVVNGEALAFVDGMTLYGMAANALDNAIEGVSRLTDPEKKVISFTVFRKLGLVFLQVENCYEGTLEFEDGLPRTRKDHPEDHGLGLKSIRRTAEEMGGFIKIETDGGLFTLRVTIPEPEA